MRRREFIGAAAAAAAAVPFAARAQQSERVRRIGVLIGYAEDDSETKSRLVMLTKELEKLGWLEGRNVRIEARFAPAGAQAQVLAKELVALQLDVILAHSAQVAAALQRETRSTPIVFVNVSDPIGTGLITSLAKPGGNLTGVLHYEVGIFGKWLAMLKEISPRTARAALVGSPKNPVYDYFLRAAGAAAPSLAIELVPNPIESAADVERSIEAFALTPNGSLILPPDITTTVHRDLIVALAVPTLRDDGRSHVLWD
jgi:putative ABC transport system substrate-binding protein